MTKLQIARFAIPQKGSLIKDQMCELCQSPDGEAAVEVKWEGVFFTKKDLFVFHRDTVRARFATEQEVRDSAQRGGFKMATSKFDFPPFGLPLRLVAGVVGARIHDGVGMAGIEITYKNPQGCHASMMLIGAHDVIEEIIRVIPSEKIQK